MEAVRVGHAWGAIYFTENFTDALVARMALGMLIKQVLFFHIIKNEYQFTISVQQNRSRCRR